MTGLLVFPVLGPYREKLQKALDFGGGVYTIEDIEEMISTGNAQMWPSGESVIVTEIVVYPHAKYIHLFLASGNLEELEGLMPSIMEWGREQGCIRASLSGRQGWGRSFLRDQGWKPIMIVMEKEL